MREARRLTRPSTNEYTRKTLAKFWTSEANILALGAPDRVRPLLEGLFLAVAAVIVTYNSEDVIYSCLDALAKMAPK